MIPEAERNSMKGLTLAELVVAMGLLVFVLTGLLSLFTNCIFLNENTRHVASALSHAQYILEEIQSATNFTAVQSQINSGRWDLDVVALNASPYNLTALPQESISTRIFQGGDPLGISVRVAWNNRGQITKSVELRTLKTNLR